MSNYDNTDSFVLFRNDKREEGSNQPEFTGKINVGGKELRLAAWVKEGQKGKFFAGKVSEFQQKGSPQPTPAQDDMDGPDDDIPF